MFEGFKQIQVQTSDPEVKINLRYGGKGPPVLLMHGNPLTHVHWHLVAPRLAKDFTVVATDLRGYGDSGKPRGREDHSNYSFRRMAQDQIEVMEHLGFTQFFAAGHDRGSRTAFRMALDHPDRVLKYASFDDPADAPRAHSCDLPMGAELIPLVFHGAALRHSGEADRRQRGLLHPEEAHQDGHRQRRLLGRDAERVCALLHARKTFTACARTIAQP